ncbi:hypothetical protein [Comamonas guangdongensis]|uniref:Hemerythrin-like domain-containing protein n=1 Tax=Comamonas guangdongensis TaxID=510515 RepID=A0ABV3ZZI1_9BURK
MTPIPHWTFSMSVQDPLLDSQHIELLEMCRSIQSDLEWGDTQNWAFRQRLDEFAFLLREHDDVEASALRQLGQNLSHGLQLQRAMALRAVETLVHHPQAEVFDPVMTQRVLCGWIRYHF